MEISVIIPAFNEEKNILNTIHSIKKWMPYGLEYEIILVDHGSTDNTVQLCKPESVLIINGSKLQTIAALRNLGVRNASGSLLVFIDADITLTESWSTHILDVLNSLKSNSLQVLGSHPQVPSGSSFFVKSWFEPKSKELHSNHIGSCHLIIAKDFFERINGFPDHMETSEDLMLCLNAKNEGAKIINCPDLMITHHGAPNTLLKFMQSEIWHGKGDWSSIYSLLSSKVALLSMFFSLFHLLLLLSFLTNNLTLSAISVLLILILCVISSAIKFSRHGWSYVLINIVTFYLYFLARSISPLSMLFSQKGGRRIRPI